MNAHTPTPITLEDELQRNVALWESHAGTARNTSP
jgi:hypothetical protein